MEDKMDYPWESVWVRSRYSQEANRFRKARMKFNAFRSLGIFDRPLGRVLEIGCGNCMFIKMVIEREGGVQGYVGVDRSNSAIERAGENMGRMENARLMVGDACNLPLKDGGFDTIIALGVLEHIENIDECLRELKRVAASDARLIISTSNKKSMMYAARLFRQSIGAWRYGFQRNDSVDSLANLLRPNFEVRRSATLHGDRDFIFSTMMDRIIGSVSSGWGRYVLAEAEIKNRG